MYTANISFWTLLQELGWDGKTYFDSFFVAITDPSVCVLILFLSTVISRNVSSFLKCNAKCIQVAYRIVTINIFLRQLCSTAFETYAALWGQPTAKYLVGKYAVNAETFVY